MAMEERQAEYT